MRPPSRRATIPPSAVALSILLSAAPSSLGAQEEQHMDEGAAALQAASAWFELLDADQFEEAWSAGSPKLREDTVAAQWQESVAQERLAWTPFEGREVTDWLYATVLPKLPPGEYVLITYLSTAARGIRVNELVLCERDADGEWRVAGYLLRRRQ